jgi:hypothetical protein
MALAPLIIRWSGDASVIFCGGRLGARAAETRVPTFQHPSARSSDIVLAFQARAEDWL